MKYILLILITALNSGCALNQIKYTAPAAGKIATINFKNNSMKILGIAFYETSKDCKGRRSTGAMSPNMEAAHKVIAGEELTFQYYLTDVGPASSGKQYCLMNLRFIPENEKTYTFNTGEDLFSCKWIMLDTTDPKKPLPVKLKSLPWNSVWDENSAFCKG